jgi:hypothetical protein
VVLIVKQTGKVEVTKEMMIVREILVLPLLVNDEGVSHQTQLTMATTQ